jgi:hypothetical protein
VLNIVEEPRGVGVAVVARWVPEEAVPAVVCPSGPALRGGRWGGRPRPSESGGPKSQLTTGMDLAADGQLPSA